MAKGNISFSGDTYTAFIPDKCPLCGSFIAPKILYAAVNRVLYQDYSSNGGSAAMACPSCRDLFTVSYPDIKSNVIINYDKISPQLPKPKDFDENIIKISPSFVEIYNQAQAAEAYNLSQICGMGYRKALEFLIKDYAKILEPDEATSIESFMLKKCIDKYIDHPKIKATATASAFLGNDETHYIRKFDDKDINDLKRFIDSCVYWILADYDATQATDLITK